MSEASAEIIRDIDVSAKDHRQFDEALLAASGEMLTPTLKKWVGGEAATIALVFTDVVGSTRMAVELGDESMEEIRQKHFDSAYGEATSHGGRVIKTIGDAFMVAFRTSVRALNFALGLSASTGHSQIEIRAGIHVGPVHVSQEDVFGTMVNYASRIVGQIENSSIWLSAQAYDHIKAERSRAHSNLAFTEHPNCALKGFKDPQTLWEVRP